VNPRLRRLVADAQQLRTEFAGHPNITVEGVGWDPPEQYRVTFRVPGVTLGTGGQPLVVEQHRALIVLPAAYPREKPYCTAETQVFHPNFGANAGEEICIGDYWTPSQSLADIVVKIGEMLQYREYNIRSPLNAVAGRWAAENEAIFPIGDIGLYQAEPVVALGDETTAGPPSKLELTLE
jgi:ubiquitin-protein ligase